MGRKITGTKKKISKQKRRIKSAALSEGAIMKYELLTQLIDNIPDVIYFKDKKGKLILVNKAHAQGLGLKPQDVVGKTDFDIFSKSRAAIMAKDDAQVMRTGKPIIDKIERATRADGVDNYVSTTKIPRYDAKGNIIGIMGITRDITSRIQLERLREEREQILKRLRVLEEMTKMKSEFLSVVSHELNTPLIVVKEALMLIIDGIAGAVNKKQKHLLLRAAANIERLKRMIDDLLDMSRLEKHKLVLHYSLVNFNDLLMSSADFFIKWAHEKNITLRYQLPPKEINIFVDPERVSQIISNLINNAIKFTEQHGRITVQVDILESKIRVGVFDTGIGIAAKDLSKLFRKFSQVSLDPTAKKGGVGLGLSIVKELVEKHGGEVWVESKPGVGSKFYFTLPRFYTTKKLDRQVRNRINKLLDKRISLYLINILIINFKEFKKRITVRPRQLFGDLKRFILETIDEFAVADRERPEVILEGYQRGEWSILFPEIKEGEAVSICNSLRRKIEQYFAHYKVRGVFINLGVMSYFQKSHVPTTRHLLTNLYVKRISIGSEVRKHERISYRANIDVIFPDRQIQPSQAMDISAGGISFTLERPFAETVDISAGGISFQVAEPLSTDAEVEVVLKPPQARAYLRLHGRVAWIKNIEEAEEGRIKRYYKVGVEFSRLSDNQKKQVNRLIQSIKSGSSGTLGNVKP